MAYVDRRGIQMQLLSNIPKTLDALHRSNDYAAALVQQYPTRFGMLAALPTDSPSDDLAEIRRAVDDLGTDGFAVTSRYDGVFLSDPMLDSVWRELDTRRATVFMHPDGYGPPSFGRPNAVIDVAFETAQTVTDMIYSGLFRRFPNVRFVVAHCGLLSALVPTGIAGSMKAKCFRRLATLSKPLRCGEGSGTCGRWRRLADWFGSGNGGSCVTRRRFGRIRQPIVGT